MRKERRGQSSNIFTDEGVRQTMKFIVEKKRKIFFSIVFLLFFLIRKILIVFINYSKWRQENEIVFPMVHQK